MQDANLLEIRNLLRPFGLDLASYSDSFLQRRILIRMRQHSLTSMTDYRALLNKDNDERKKLTELLSVTVTEFFRDEMFTDTVLDPLFAKMVAKARNKQLNCWSAGCATGQEPYSLAILLDSYLSAKSRSVSFKIHATDISDANLKVAASGAYPKQTLAQIPPKFQKYFIEQDGKAVVAPTLRQFVDFRKADLCDVAPFSGLDIIFCRNVMIYMTPEAKSVILKRFHACLPPGAYLVLGASEIILEPTLFKPLDTRHKIYERV